MFCIDKSSSFEPKTKKALQEKLKAKLTYDDGQSICKHG